MQKMSIYRKKMHQILPYLGVKYILKPIKYQNLAKNEFNLFSGCIPSGALNT